jgi:predicted AAA+ superfamily ATPase
MTALEKMNLDLHALVVFRNLLDDPVMKSLVALLSDGKTPAEQVKCYADFASRLYEEGGDLTQYILSRVLEDENIYVRTRARDEAIDDTLTECVERELKALEKVARLASDTVKASIAYDGYLPGWETSTADFAAAYTDRMAHIGTRGYGVFSRYHVFAVRDGAVEPVPRPDPIRLGELVGYDAERKEVMDNTLALLAGKPAANALLYGDAGTGKSSTIKAIVNEYHDQGLRLIEIKKKQFTDIPDIVEALSTNPLKFILFIDDLTFAEETDDFNALKAILEGSVTARTPNLAIYATSNRRHIIRETFSGRAGDDIHRNETMQELCSLSERFGLSVSFFSPDKELYLRVVRGLKGQYGIKMEDTVLAQEAERYAYQRGGRSPRVARQFVEYLASREG